ncbi:MAG: VCBS repeat-containing protein [Planctomycetes bacterium]|nr:VCBS repeat-containing protein [Planctomycetota bacterium]
MSTIKFALLAALTIACWFRTSTAQFAKFVDETSQRSVVAGNLFATDSQEKDYAWGDVDKDGDIDLVIVRKEPFSTAGRRVNLLLINENGVLVDRTSEFASASDVFGDLGFNTPTNDRDVVLVDVNNDGWLDIVTSPTITEGLAKHISHPRVYINLGDDPPKGGVWQGFEYQDARIPEMHPTSGPRFCGMAAGDLTGNGLPDLYFADYDDGVPGQTYDYQNKLLVNVANGIFFDESLTRMGSLFDYGGVVGIENYLFSSFGTATAIGDMNNDGVNDVVKQTALHPPYHLAIVYNDPENEGFFNQYDVINTAGGYHVSIGELNNDGILDIVVTQDGADEYMLGTTLDANGRRNYLTINFPNVSQGFGGNSVIADLNNDGLNDVVITGVDVHNSGCSAKTHIFRNLGGDIPPFSTEDLTVGIPENLLRGGHDVAIFDLNGDGWLDIVHGRCNSTEIWIQHPYGIIFDYPQDLPTFVAQNMPFIVQAQLTPIGGTIASGTPALHYAINDDVFTSVMMQHLGGNLYEAALPPGTCLDRINYYFSATMNEEKVLSIDPPDAPTVSYTAVVADGLEVTYLNNFESGDDVSHWAIESDASLVTGEWEQADPNGTFWFGQAAPEDDATPGEGNVMAFVTDNGPPGGGVNANDVDGGPTYLISPSFDLQDTNAMISYARWFFTIGGTPDALTIEVSNDGSNWVIAETVDGPESEWYIAEFLVSDFVEPSQSVQVRFSTADADSSITEAGIDDFQVEQFICDPACLGDLDGNGSVDTSDLLELFAQWGTAGPADFDKSGTVDTADLLILFANWGPCP